MSQSDVSSGGARNAVPEEGVLVGRAKVLEPGKKDEGVGASQEKGAPHVVKIPRKQ